MVESADLEIDGPVAPLQLNARPARGRVATAVVAALVVIAGVYIARSILGIAVLAPKAAAVSGAPPRRSTPRSPPRARCSPPACCMSCCSKHPRPLSFFTWITALADLILVVAPFSQPLTPAEQGLHRGDQSGRGRGRDLGC